MLLRAVIFTLRLAQYGYRTGLNGFHLLYTRLKKEVLQIYIKHRSVTFAKDCHMQNYLGYMYKHRETVRERCSVGVRPEPS